MKQRFSFQTSFSEFRQQLMIRLLPVLSPFFLRSTVSFLPCVQNLRPGTNLPWERFDKSFSGIVKLNSNGSDNIVGAQDLSELFDLYQPPSHPNSVVLEPPAKTGEAKPRSLVHKDGDWHRSVHIWVIEKGNKNILLQRRSPGKDTFPNRLDVSCAGHVTSGDDIDETAIRELEEELGMTTVSLEKIKDSRAFTFAATIEGETPSHGQFICKEFQEVFVLKQDYELDAKSFAPLLEEEVSGFEVATVADVLCRLEQEDEKLVPRTKAYVQALHAAIFDQGKK
mmetsp:Transcript_12264/g.18807  ORF Transcript_12264/g.18807 Transcript_12264/m.18807 type:complete len:282 (-) Transcript_12264:338-1183(-)